MGRRHAVQTKGALGRKRLPRKVSRWPQINSCPDTEGQGNLFNDIAVGDRPERTRETLERPNSIGLDALEMLADMPSPAWETEEQ